MSTATLHLTGKRYAKIQNIDNERLESIARLLNEGTTKYVWLETTGGKLLVRVRDIIDIEVKE